MGVGALITTPTYRRTREARTYDRRAVITGAEHFSPALTGRDWGLLDPSSISFPEDASSSDANPRGLTPPVGRPLVADQPALETVREGRTMCPGASLDMVHLNMYCLSLFCDRTRERLARKGYVSSFQVHVISIEYNTAQV